MPSVEMACVDAQTPTETTQPERPEPDPLAVFASSRGGWRLGLTGLAAIVCAAGFLAFGGLLAVLSGLAVAAGSPVDPVGMEYQSGDDAAETVTFGVLLRTPTVVAARS